MERAERRGERQSERFRRRHQYPETRVQKTKPCILEGRWLRRTPNVGNWKGLVGNHKAFIRFFCREKANVEPQTLMWTGFGMNIKGAHLATRGAKPITRMVLPNY